LAHAGTLAAREFVRLDPGAAEPVFVATLVLAMMAAFVWG
jgi:hypothetical protein